MMSLIHNSIVPEGMVGSNEFGYCVAISGEVVVVGMPGENNQMGSAYVFQKRGTQMMSKLIPFDGAFDDHFGSSVAIDGDFIVVGSPYLKVNTVSTGSAYVFAIDGTVVEKLIPNDGGNGDRFGYSVGINGENVVVGAPYAHNTEGRVYVFNGFGDTNNQTGTILTDSNPLSYNYFGFSVAINDEMIVVGMRTTLSSRVSSVHVYYIDGTFWRKITSVSTGTYFGWSVGISGDLIVVGAPNDGTDGWIIHGAVYLFDMNGVQIAKIIPHNGVSGVYFGQSVAISGDIVVVLSRYSVDKGANSGSVYIYNTDGELLNMLSVHDGTIDVSNRVSVGICGDKIILGAPSVAYFLYSLSGSSISPTFAPTITITSFSPSQYPSNAPTTSIPTSQPTKTPTTSPSKTPTFHPTTSPTEMPTVLPSKSPTPYPTLTPTFQPTVTSSQPPSRYPTSLTVSDDLQMCSFPFRCKH